MDVITFHENLTILLHGVISLPDGMSYDKCTYPVWSGCKKISEVANHTP